jgi:poly-gamma-glutamate capsule biosynthesis protein CapA/YwtB (metallophosphatase superfamily)
MKKTLLLLIVILVLVSSTAITLFFYFYQHSVHSFYQELSSPSTLTNKAELPPSNSSGQLTFSPPQISQILSDNHQWTATLPAERKVTVLSTGDVLLARSINYKIQQQNDFSWPFIHIADVLKDSDITFINLETPLVPDCHSRVDGMIFCGKTNTVLGLNFAGVDVANFANNHAGNQGIEGVQNTVETLKDHDILIAGVAGPVYKDVHGTTIAFLGYNEVDQQPGIAASEPDLIATEIQEAKQHADIVIVQFHWGVEYTRQPTAHQRELARLAIDNGADAIIGNHPHWYQAIEMYKQKPILYSHGNLVFDQMWSQETREGLISKMTFFDHQLVDIEVTPVLIENFGQPRVMNTAEKVAVMKTLQQETSLLQEK